MARHRSFSSEFKRRIAQEFLDGRAGMHELVCRHNEAVRVAEYERKIAEPERKVGQLTMEVDLLKKRVQLGRRISDESYSIVSGPKASPSREDVES